MYHLICLRELRIYGGYQGIWVDREKTEGLANSGLGVTTGLLHTGVHYPDDLSETGIIYHYPQTNRPPSRDEGEIEATKAAYTLSLPVFVITKPFPNSTTRDVNLGWIEGWDDNLQVFRISFVSEEPAELLAQPEDESPFSPQEETSNSTTITKTRPGQQRFSFRVFQRYGEKCAVCDLDLPELLDAAHLIPKKHNGTDDPRNGIVLCSLHHRALDAGLFWIDPDTLRICYRENGPDAAALRITRSDLSHLHQLPHPTALKWLKDNWEGLY
jgi:putative restriction endonuclease